MKDSTTLLRLRRLMATLSTRVRKYLAHLFPYAVVLAIGMSLGAESAEMRIHNDCKMLTAFRIGHIGYACKIAR